MQQDPDFVRDSPLLREALGFAREAHHGPARLAATAMEHPIAVAKLLFAAGFEGQVVAAGLLHEVIEETSIPLEEVRSRFGREVASLVEEMTEDPSIRPYEARKAEHRARVAEAGPPAAAIYAADKLAKVRSLPESEIDRLKLDHYARTLQTLQLSHPELPFLEELRAELERLR